MPPVPCAMIRSIADRCIVLLGTAYEGQAYLEPGRHYVASGGDMLLDLGLSDMSEFHLAIWKGSEPVFDARWGEGQTMKVEICPRMDWVAWLEKTDA
jgi:hypothetical protein